MIAYIRQRLNKNQFFIQILAVVVFAIIITASITILMFISITEQNVTNNFKHSHQLVINEVITNYNNMFEDSISVLDTLNNQNTLKNYMIAKHDSTVEGMNISYNMTRLMKEVDLKLTTLESNLFIVTDNSVYYGFGDVRISSDEVLMNDPLFTDITNPNIKYSIVNSGFTNFTKDKPQLLIHRNLYDESDSYYGHVVLNFSLQTLDNMYQRLIPSGQDMVYFVNDSNELLHSVSGIPFSESMLQDKQYIYIEDKLPIPGVRMLSFIKKSSLKKEVYRINTLILSISIICAIFAIVLFQIVRKLTNPIYALSDALDHVDLAKIDKQSVGGTFEIQQLTDSYNQMLEDVNHHINDLLELEEKKMQSDLTALLRQISPHFIYNTLTSIRYLIISHQNEKAAEALEDFIAMLQSLTHFDQGMTTIEDEKILLNHYARLNKLRFGPSIQCHISAEQGMDHLQIPQLILQPIVENAFFHAFDHDGGFINIHFSATETLLLIEVMDNGKGMNQEQIDQIYEQMQQEKPLMHVGISNVHQRIVMQFGPQYGLTIYSEPQKGTIVTLTLPLIT